MVNNTLETLLVYFRHRCKKGLLYIYALDKSFYYTGWIL